MTVAELVKQLMTKPADAEVYLELECMHGSWFGTQVFNVLSHGPGDQKFVGLVGKVVDGD